MIPENGGNEEDGAIPEAFLLILLVPGSVIEPDIGGDDIQHQGEPAKADDGAEDSI